MGEITGTTLWVCMCVAVAVGFLVPGIGLAVVGNIAAPDYGPREPPPRTQVNVTLMGVSEGDLGGKYLRVANRNRPGWHLCPDPVTHLIQDAFVPASVLPRNERGFTYVPVNATGLVDPMYLPATVLKRSERGRPAGGTAYLDAEGRLPASLLTQRGGPESTTELGQADGYCPVNTTTGKIDERYLPPLGMAIRMRGQWDPLTNTPNITSGVGEHGDMYVVSVSGSRLVDGQSVWYQGNGLIFDTHVWVRIAQVDAVLSVNGRQGAVRLDLGALSDVSTTASVPTASAVLVMGASGAWEPQLNPMAEDAVKVVAASTVSGTSYIADSGSDRWWGLVPSGGASWSAGPMDGPTTFELDVVQSGSVQLPMWTVHQTGLYHISVTYNLESDSDTDIIGLCLFVGGQARHTAVYHMDFGCDTNDNALCHYPYWITTVQPINAGETVSVRVFSPTSDTLRAYANSDLTTDPHNLNGNQGTASARQTYLTMFRIA
jgi:hypothetical protein